MTDSQAPWPRAALDQYPPLETWQTAWALAHSSPEQGTSGTPPATVHDKPSLLELAPGSQKPAQTSQPGMLSSSDKQHAESSLKPTQQGDTAMPSQSTRPQGPTTSPGQASSSTPTPTEPQVLLPPPQHAVPLAPPQLRPAPPLCPWPLQVLRSSQLDAQRLDVELHTLLKEQLLKAFMWFRPAHVADLEPELNALLRLLVFGFSVMRGQSTPGSQLLNLRYRSEPSTTLPNHPTHTQAKPFSTHPSPAAVSSTSTRPKQQTKPSPGSEGGRLGGRSGVEGSGLGLGQKLFLGAGMVLLPYLWARLGTALARASAEQATVSWADLLAEEEAATQRLRQQQQREQEEADTQEKGRQQQQGQGHQQQGPGHQPHQPNQQAAARRQQQQRHQQQQEDEELHGPETPQQHDTSYLTREPAQLGSNPDPTDATGAGTGGGVLGVVLRSLLQSPSRLLTLLWRQLAVLGRNALRYLGLAAGWVVGRRMPSAGDHSGDASSGRGGGGGGRVGGGGGGRVGGGGWAGWMPTSEEVWRGMQRVEGVYRAAALANLLLFLAGGRYRSLLERLAGARLVYQQPVMTRIISFEYLNRQLVWQEVSELLLFALPLLDGLRARGALSRLLPRLPDPRRLLGSALGAATGIRAAAGAAVAAAGSRPRSPTAAAAAAATAAATGTAGGSGVAGGRAGRGKARAALGGGEGGAGGSPGGFGSSGEDEFSGGFFEELPPPQLSVSPQLPHGAGVGPVTRPKGPCPACGLDDMLLPMVAVPCGHCYCYYCLASNTAADRQYECPCDGVRVAAMERWKPGMRVSGVA